MRVLHTVLMREPTSGIISQMRWEQQAALEIGLDWDVKILCPNENGSSIFIECSHLDLVQAKEGVKRKIFWLRFRYIYYMWLMRNVNKYDVILLRHSVYNPFELLFLAMNRNKKIYLVHHTLEVPELDMERRTIKATLQVFFEKILGWGAISLSSGVVGVTQEILNYEKSRAYKQIKSGFVYPNGIYYGSDGCDLVESIKTNIPSFIFVASYFSVWHGLDLLLNSIQKSDDKFVLHLVGEMSANDKARASSDSRIVIHDKLNEHQISELSKKCWVGLASFALYRKKMNQACTLKVREYLINGLPVYSGYKDIFPDDFRFYKFGSPDISSLIQYAQFIKAADPATVSRMAAPFISKSKILIGFHEWLLGQQNK